MCEIIEGDSNLLPGWGCHRCRVYNGFQRKVCKSCGKDRCKLDLPEKIRTCPGCGAGYLDQHLTWMRKTVRVCPVQGCEIKIEEIK